MYLCTQAFLLTVLCIDPKLYCAGMTGEHACRHVWHDIIWRHRSWQLLVQATQRMLDALENACTGRVPFTTDALAWL